MAAALEQASPHVLGGCHRPCRPGARLELTLPSEVMETAGAGVRGCVNGRSTAVGSAAYVVDGGPMPAWVRDLQRRAAIEGTTNVYVSVDGQVTRRARAR